MNSNEITNRLNEISLRQAAFVAGFGILIMVITGPFAQMYAYGSLIVPGKAAETAQNIMNNKTLYLTVFEPDQLYVQLYLSLVAFEKGYGIGLIVFSIHLGLLGYLVFRSGYIPRILGILLIISGLGWLIDSLRPYLFPNIYSELWMVTVLGEVIFMLWLLIKGWKIQESN